jgi:LysR family transcriptional regulator, transcriptional activator of the cysJI operon
MKFGFKIPHNRSMPQLENFRLRVFRAVAAHLNFRKAGEQLFLTQPAVTLQIKALENDLGIRLFDRSGGRITLTAQGSILLKYANKLANLAAIAEQDLGCAEDMVFGELKLGASTTIAQYVLPRLLGAFQSEYPKIQVSLYSGNTSAVVRYLIEGKVDLGLIEGPARERGVRTEPFMKDELVLIASPTHESGRLSRAEFLSRTLLMREQGSGSRRVVETALEKADYKLKAFEKVMELDSTESIKSAVEAGLGVGVVSRWAIAKELELETLKIAEVSGLKATRDFTLISRRGPDSQGPAAALRTFALGRGRILSNGPRKTMRVIQSDKQN